MAWLRKPTRPAPGGGPDIAGLDYDGVIAAVAADDTSPERRSQLGDPAQFAAFQRHMRRWLQAQDRFTGLVDEDPRVAARVRAVPRDQPPYGRAWADSLAAAEWRLARNWRALGQIAEEEEERNRENRKGAT